MNETYEWLYDHYALPLMQRRVKVDAVKREILSCKSTASDSFLHDQLENLCLLWGTEAFSLGLQLGLRLMAGQSVDVLRPE